MPPNTPGSPDTPLNLADLDDFIAMQQAAQQQEHIQTLAQAAATLAQSQQATTPTSPPTAPTPAPAPSGYATWMSSLEEPNPFASPFPSLSRKKARYVRPQQPEIKDEDMPALDAKPGFTFGCDPELFIKNEKGVYVSAAGLIPGTKAEPYKVNKGWVQVDGMAAEFNIEPVDNYKDWNENIQTVMDELKKMLPKGYKLDAVPSVTFTPEIFDAAPDEAKELGCHPDCDAWEGDVNPPPNVENFPYLRTAAGHIHIGWKSQTGGTFDLTDPQHIMNCRDLVKQLDWYLGAWSLKMDKDKTRRSLYGKAGACRYKEYGVEYRVLSNFWVINSARRLIVWNRLQAAINAMAKTYLPDMLSYGHQADLRQSINESKLNPKLSELCHFPVNTLDANQRRF